MDYSQKRGRPITRPTALSVIRSAYDTFRPTKPPTKSRDAFAELLGLKTRTYRAYEKGERPIPPEKAKRIADTLGVSVMSLVSGDGRVRETEPIEISGLPFNRDRFEAWIKRPDQSRREARIRARALTEDSRRLSKMSRSLMTSAARAIEVQVGTICENAGAARFQSVYLAVRDSLKRIAEDHGFLPEYEEALGKSQVPFTRS